MLQYMNNTITKAFLVGLNNQSNRSIEGNPTQSWIVDSTPWIPESRFFVITWIPDTLSSIPDSKAQDYRFHKQKWKGTDYKLRLFEVLTFHHFFLLQEGARILK